MLPGFEGSSLPVPMPPSMSINTGHRAQSSGSVDSAGGGEGQTLNSLLPFGADELGSSGGMDMSTDDVNKHREKNRNAQVQPSWCMPADLCIQCAIGLRLHPSSEHGPLAFTVTVLSA